MAEMNVEKMAKFIAENYDYDDFLSGSVFTEILNQNDGRDAVASHSGSNGIGIASNNVGFFVQNLIKHLRVSYEKQLSYDRKAKGYKITRPSTLSGPANDDLY